MIYQWPATWEDVRQGDASSRGSTGRGCIVTSAITAASVISARSALHAGTDEPPSFHYRSSMYPLDEWRWILLDPCRGSTGRGCIVTSAITAAPVISARSPLHAGPDEPPSFRYRLSMYPLDEWRWILLDPCLAVARESISSWSSDATRYPEAIALRTIDANQIAMALVSFFSRVGLPEDILTDQATNFTSQLLQVVYRLLRIKPIGTTPYHPQTDGLVQRFNQTIKTMLKKTEGKNWDELLPYLLFTYREASTDFSLFELVYGRPVRGPLDILKVSWESSPKSSKSVVSYVQERLQNLCDLVRINLQQTQTAQKLWYDRNARSRAFDPGDQVLVLLPTSNNTLLAEWQGPYQITRRVSKVNYELRMTH